jgi:heat shock protein HtpX
MASAQLFSAMNYLNSTHLTPSTRLKKPTLTKVWLFFLGLMFALLIYAYFLAGREGLFGALLICVAFSLLIFFRSESHILQSLKATPLKGQDAWGLGSMIERYCHLLRTPLPSLYLIHHSTATALSFGSPSGKTHLAVTTGLLERLSQKEIEAVIAHQLCNLQRINTFGLAISQMVSQVIIGAAQLLDQFMPKKMNTLFASLASPIAQIILKISIREKFIFENDDRAIEILHDRRTLSEALWKLENMAHATPIPILLCSSHFFIVNPMGSIHKKSLLLTHPKIEYRIKRLIGYWPI